LRVTLEHRNQSAEKKILLLGPRRAWRRGDVERGAAGKCGRFIPNFGGSNVIGGKLDEELFARRRTEIGLLKGVDEFLSCRADFSYFTAVWGSA